MEESVQLLKVVTFLANVKRMHRKHQVSEASLKARGDEILYVALRYEGVHNCEADLLLRVVVLSEETCEKCLPLS